MMERTGKNGARDTGARDKATGDKAGREHAGTLRLAGGRLCLDFVNTVDWHAGGNREERLRDYGDLAAWCVHVGLLPEGGAGPLLALALRQPGESGRVLRRARVLRESLYRVFQCATRNEPPPGAELEGLNEVLDDAGPGFRVRPGETGLVWDWRDAPAVLAGMLWPIAWDAAGLLTSADLGRVRQCADAQCGWLFLDRSRNRSRNWCSMETCGNRAKARRHYRRHRAQAAPESLTETPAGE